VSNYYPGGKMKLYIKKSCPFSMKVLSFASEIGEYNSLNIVECDDSYEDNNSIELEINGGKLQVPCLQIGKEWIYESDEIIKRLRLEFQNYSDTPITDYTSTVFTKFIKLKKKIGKLEMIEG